MKQPTPWMLNQIKAHAGHLSYWLRWLGLTVEQRRAFWLALAGREK